MLPKSQRYHLRKHPDFFATASRRHFPGFSLYWQSVPTGSTGLTAPHAAAQATAAVIVPKKAGQTAVYRNTTKRRVRAALSPTLKQLRPQNIVVVVQKPLDQEKLFFLIEQVLRCCGSGKLT